MIAIISFSAILILGLIVYTFTHFKPGETSGPSQTIGFLPLGDSYTIGQSVAQSDRWPNQLASRFMPNGYALTVVANPAVTGYTTQDLIDTELPLVKTLQPDLVSIQIGVNDYIQGVTAEQFRKNLAFIIEDIQKTIATPSNIVLVTIPDYTLTPAGAGYGDPASSQAAIRQFNEIIKQTAAVYTLPVADIYTISQAVATDTSLTAEDGLHPSAQQYTLWADLIRQTMITAGIPR